MKTILTILAICICATTLTKLDNTITISQKNISSFIYIDYNNKYKIININNGDIYTLINLNTNEEVINGDIRDILFYLQTNNIKIFSKYSDVVNLKMYKK